MADFILFDLRVRCVESSSWYFLNLKDTFVSVSVTALLFKVH